MRNPEFETRPPKSADLRRLFLRRAFLLAAVSALAPVAQRSRADDEPVTLFDALTQAASLAPPSSAPAALPRHALGPIPGFTVPVSTDTAVDDAIFAPKRPRRRSIFGPMGDYVGRLQQATGTHILLHGSSNFSYRSDSISGSAEAYSGDQYYGQGSNGFYNLSRMDVDATFFDSVHYRTSFNNDALANRNDPNSNRVAVDYHTRNTRIQWGDINAGIQGNSLIDFSRYMHGVQIKQNWSKQFSTQIIYSQAKTETRTITLNGNGSSGPYYVYAGQIVDGSARVRINNRELTMGKDYTLDLYTGELRFQRALGDSTPPIIALPSDTIAVSFETVGYGGSTGSLYGGRVDYALRPGLHIGLTDIVQTSNGSSGINLRTQEFYGYNTPAAAYTLDAPIDANKPLTVTVGGVPLVKGTDYVIDANLSNQIRIAQAVPSTLVVRIQYYPLVTSITPGNRGVKGVDARISLGKWGSVSTEMAFSGLDVQGTNYGGQAWQIRADLLPMRGLHTNIALRNVGATFSSIETPGFNRNEKSIQLDADYTPDRRWQFKGSYLRAKRPSYANTGITSSAFTVNTLGNDDYNQYNGSVLYSFAKTGNLSLSHDYTGTNYIQGGHSGNTSDRFNASYGIGVVTLTGSISRNVSHSDTPSSLYSGTGLASIYNNDANTFSKQIGLSWTPNRRLSLNASASDNATQNTSLGTNSSVTSRETQISARYLLLRNVSMSYSYALSDTGNLYNATTATTTTTTTTGAATGTTTTGTTTTGANGTGSSTRGIPQAFRWLTRDVTAGGAGTSTTTTTTTNGVAGGGSNYNLGGYGNYSGVFGNGLNTGYGIGSYGGRSASNHIGLEIGPIRDITLGLSFDTSSSVGDNQFNSSRNNIAVQMAWQMSRRWTFDGSFSLQKTAYVGSLGSASSNSWQVNMGGHPFGNGISLILSMGSQRTNSNINFSTTTTTATTDGNSDLTSFRARVDFPISSRYSLFADMQQSNVTGSLGTSDSNLSFGASYSLTKAVNFSLGWQIIRRDNKDPQYAVYNYKVSSILAQLGFNFR